jgi:hypothetical protein
MNLELLVNVKVVATRAMGFVGKIGMKQLFDFFN